MFVSCLSDFVFVPTIYDFKMAIPLTKFLAVWQHGSQVMRACTIKHLVFGWGALQVASFILDDRQD